MFEPESEEDSDTEEEAVASMLPFCQKPLQTAASQLCTLIYLRT